MQHSFINLFQYSWEKYYFHHTVCKHPSGSKNVCMYWVLLYLGLYIQFLVWVPGSLHSFVRRIGDCRVERRNLLNFYLCVEQWGRIQLFQVGSPEHINWVSLGLYICPQKGQIEKKGAFSTLPHSACLRCHYCNVTVFFILTCFFRATEVN